MRARQMTRTRLVGPSDAPRWYVYGQGGGWLGRFTLPIWVHLMAEGTPDEVGGASVSALHATLAAQGDLDKGEELWDAIDDNTPMDGIKGFTGLSLKRGVWHMKGLHRKIEKIVKVRRVRIPCRVGVCTREPFAHHSLAAADARGKKQWQNWVSASARIAFVFRPIDIRIGGKKYSGRDGGHMFSVPWIPHELRPGDRVDFLLHNPLDAHESDVPDLGENKLLGELKWLLWAHFKTGHWEILRRAETLAKEGVDVRLWAPPVPLGDMLDGRKETLDERDELGKAVVRAGPIRLL